MYSRDGQVEAAKKIILALVEVLRGTASPVESIHVRTLLMTFISLCKEQAFAHEEEYRLVLVRKNLSQPLPMGYSRAVKLQQIHYIRAKMPAFRERFLLDCQNQV